MAITSHSFSTAEIAAAYEKAKKLPEYEKLLNLSTDVSGQIQVKRGTFKFYTTKSDSKVWYVIYAHGQIRRETPSGITKSNTPSLTTSDLAENYRRMFERVIQLINNKNEKMKEYDTQDTIKRTRSWKVLYSQSWN